MKNVHESIIITKAKAEESAYKMQGEQVVIIPTKAFIEWLEWLDRMITQPQDLPAEQGHARPRKEKHDHSGDGNDTQG
jgi:hypothetical protein